MTFVCFSETSTGFRNDKKYKVRKDELVELSCCPPAVALMLALEASIHGLLWHSGPISSLRAKLSCLGIAEGARGESGGSLRDIYDYRFHTVPDHCIGFIGSLAVQASVKSHLPVVQFFISLLSLRLGTWWTWCHLLVRGAGPSVSEGNGDRMEFSRSSSETMSWVVALASIPRGSS